MTRDEAAKLLGVVNANDSGIVKLAWSKAVRAVHPDLGSDATGTDAALQIALVTKARDLLLQTGPEPCTSCKGVGKVRRRFGSVDCGACKGTGDKIG